jgi:glycosyltransferase involved in cell wall biosynthesis
MARVQQTSLRVAGVDPERRFGGGETQVLGLTRELRRRGHRAELLCDPDGELWRRAQAAGIVCQPLRVRSSIDVAAGLRLRGLLARGDYDVVHFHTSRAHALAPYVGGDARLRIVTRRMDYRPNRLFARYLYNRAVDGVIAISRGVADTLQCSGVEPARMRVVPSGVNCEHFAPPTMRECEAARARLGLRPTDIAVGAVGALTPRKGHRFLLEAVALARRTEVAGANLRGFIAGDGPLARELGERAPECGVRMLGALDDPRSLLWALDIFVMSSLREGLGVAALEAMACGLPLIATGVGGLSEVVEDGVCGRTIPPGDVMALAREIGLLAAAPLQRAAMGAAARARALSEFSLESMAAQTLACYQELCAKRNRRAGDQCGA